MPLNRISSSSWYTPSESDSSIVMDEILTDADSDGRLRFDGSEGPRLTEATNPRDSLIVPFLPSFLPNYPSPKTQSRKGNDHNHPRPPFRSRQVSSRHRRRHCRRLG